MKKQIIIFLLCLVGLCLTQNILTSDIVSAFQIVEEENQIKKRAFIVAVSDYAEANELSCTIQDALEFKRQLLKLGFEEQNIVFLTSEENFANLPTKKNIQSQYADFLMRVNEGDWVVVYLSGHGIQIPGKAGSWFCPPETEVSNLEETTVSIDKMLTKLSNSKAGFLWMIVDACRDIQGEDKNIFKEEAIPSQAIEIFLKSPANMSLIQSCQPKCCSYEHPTKKNSIFTQSLIEALSMKADRNEDGILTFLEICNYVSQRTNELAKQHIGKPQIPQIMGKIADFKFYCDPNYPKAELLIQKAQKEQEIGNVQLAMKLAIQAYLLCPYIEKFRDEMKRSVQTKASFEQNFQKEIVWPSDGMTLQEAYDKTDESTILTIKAGVHDVPETLVIRKNITIVGEDSSSHSTCVLRSGRENVLRVESGFAEIKNLTFKNVGDGRFPVSEKYSNVTPEEIAKHEWFNVRHSAVSVQTPICIFKNCAFLSEKGCGFSVNGPDAMPILTACEARNCKGSGFRISNGAGGMFADCLSRENAAHGMEVKDCGTNPTVQNCRFMKNLMEGISIKNTAEGTFTECEAAGNALDGFFLQHNGTNPTIQKCQFTSNHRYGIGIVDGADGMITDCKFIGNALDGMLLFGSGTNPTVQKCQFLDNRKSGISIEFAAAGTFTDCNFARNVSAGITLFGNGTNPAVENCKFTNNEKAGIAIFLGASGTFTECVSSENRFSGIQVSDSGSNPMVKNCRFIHGKSSGITVIRGAAGTFTNCDICENTKSGVAILDAETDPTVQNCQIWKNRWGISITKSAKGTFQKNSIQESPNGNWIIENGCSPIREENLPNE